MKLNKILSVITSAVIAFITPAVFCNCYQNQSDLTAIAAVDENKTYDSWQEGYRAVLDDFRQSSDYNDIGTQSSAFELCDVDGNGIPELFISEGMFQTAKTIIYTFNDNECIKLLEQAWSNGALLLNTEHQYIIYSNSYAGNTNMSVYKINGTELLVLDTYYDDSIIPQSGTAVYKHNGSTVTKESYQASKAKYDSLSVTGIGRKQSFDDLYYEYKDIYYSFYFTYYEAYATVSSALTTLSIPNTVNGFPVTGIGSYLLKGTSVKTLNIPANVYNFYYYGLNGEALTAINVDSANPHYSSKDGIMYNKDMTKLIKFPTAKDSSGYIFPQSITEIGRYAFAWCNGVKKIVIPDTVDTIINGAFYSCPNLSSITIMNSECDIYDYWENGDGITICNTYDSTTGKGNYLGVICGYDNSTVQNYADNFGRTFISLGTDPALITTTTTAKTTTTTVKTTTTTTITTTATKPNGSTVYVYTLGDVNGDNIIDASDASLILEEYSLLSTGQTGNFPDNVKELADLSKDGIIDSSDASLILGYYSHVSTGGKSSLEQWLNSLN